MKSKAVASIMRHVATRVSLGPNAEEPAPSTDAPPAEVKPNGKDLEDDGEEEPVIAETEEARLEHLYETIAWPLEKKYGHPYDGFKMALT